MSRPVRLGTPPATIDALEPQKKRGRPRSTGTLHCDRCHGQVAKIRVHWPEGAICGACFTQAVRSFGICPQCATERLLPGLDASGRCICRDCAGITRPIMDCSNCGAEAERFRGGWCARCVIAADLTAVLKPHNPPDLRIKRLVDTLTNSRRPESIHTWMRGTHARILLAKIGNRELELTHAAFDALPRSSAVEHLRQILEHHRMLPAGTDPHLRYFERWLHRRLNELQDHPDIALAIERFATWHHLKRLRAKIGTANMDIACRDARQEITETGKFLLWVHESRGHPAGDFDQSDIDAYLSEGTSTRWHIRNYVSWLSKARRGPGELYVAPRYARTEPSLGQSRRLEVIRNAIEMDEVTLPTRVAALIHLLWATSLSRIVRLRRDSITLGAQGMLIAIGSTPTEIPEEIAPLFWQVYAGHNNQQTANTNTEWLFPGRRAGQHIAAPTLQQRFKVLGLDPQSTRNTTLKSLTAQIDVRSLAEMLGYSAETLAKHAEKSGNYWSSYVEAKAAARRTGRPGPHRII